MDQNMYRLYKMSKMKNMWVGNNEAILSNEINTSTDLSHREFIKGHQEQVCETWSGERYRGVAGGKICPVKGYLASQTVTQLMLELHNKLQDYRKVPRG